MVFTSAGLGGTQQEAAAADKPLVVSRNVIEDINAEAEWNTLGTWAGTDITDTLFPSSNLYNGQLHLGSTPTLTTSNPIHIVFDLNNVFFNVVMLKLVQLSSSGTYAFKLEVDDVNTFDSGTLETVSEFTGVTSTGVAPRRLVDLSLGSGGAQQYSNVRWMRLTITRDPDGAHVTMPIIGELFLGLRRQFAHKLKLPFDDKPTSTDARDFVARSRARQRFLHSRGARDVRGSWSATNADGKGFAAGTIDTVTLIRTLYSESDDGSKPVLYIEDPSTDPDVCLMGYIEDPDLRMNAIGPIERNAPWSFVEIPQFRTREP
jgi:hypothetical protein